MNQTEDSEHSHLSSLVRTLITLEGGSCKELNAGSQNLQNKVIWRPRGIEDPLPRLCCYRDYQLVSANLHDAVQRTVPLVICPHFPVGELFRNTNQPAECPPLLQKFC